jgi:hypothetical protein
LKLLKELIWGRKFTFESELSSTEFIEKLKSKTTASSIFYPDRPNKIFVGKIRGNSIWLRRHIPIRKAFTPLLSASVKDFEEKSAGKMKQYLNKNPDFVMENISSFEKELEFIGSKNPILIAFGNDCYTLLKTHLPKYTVIKVIHYSSFTTNEKRREQILEKEKYVKQLLNMPVSNVH